MRNTELLLLAGLAVSAQAQLVMVTNQPGMFVPGIDIPANLIPGSQSDDTPVPLTIPAAYANEILSGAVFASPNGRLIDTSSTEFNNAGLSTNLPKGYYIYWDDLRTDRQTTAAPASGIYTLDTGAAFIVQWNVDVFSEINSGAPSGPAGFARLQLRIFPTGSTTRAQFLYRDMGTMTGQSATIGALSASVNQPMPYRFNAAGSVSDSLTLSIVPQIPGACCLPTLACFEGFTIDCLSQGGVFHGQNTSCAAITCPGTGACCVPHSASCIITSPIGCTIQGGTFMGAGVTCAAASCPGPGACCMPLGNCTQTTREACNNDRGAYQGNGVQCAAVNCVDPGACCLNDGTCREAFPAGCVFLNGVFRGTGVTCTSANCPPAGACCKADGSCITLTQTACSGSGGVFSGGATCASFVCPGGFGFSSAIPGTFTDISATGTPIPITLGSNDDGTGPFTSTVTNALVTDPDLFACTNGLISNLGAFREFSNLPLPISGPTFGLFPNWDDLVVVQPILHQHVQEGGVGVHIIQWDDVHRFGGIELGSFQVKIFGPGGPALVQYIYREMAWDFNGNSSTVGVQWSATSHVQRSFGIADEPPAAPPFPIPDHAVFSIVAFSAPCEPNCDASTTQPCLNVQDFACFLNRFAAADSRANCDRSTTAPVLNVQDFACFLNQFAGGCSAC